MASPAMIATFGHGLVLRRTDSAMSGSSSSPTIRLRYPTCQPVIDDPPLAAADIDQHVVRIDLDPRPPEELVELLVIATLCHDGAQVGEAAGYSPPQ